MGNPETPLGSQVNGDYPQKILTGPRQAGKTALLLELQRDMGSQSVYFAGDDPNAGLPGFRERVWMEAEGRAHKEPGVLPPRREVGARVRLRERFAV